MGYNNHRGGSSRRWNGDNSGNAARSDVYYMAEVVERILDRAPYGVIVVLNEREDIAEEGGASLEGKRALIRTSFLSPVVESLQLHEIVRVYRVQMKEDGRKYEAKLAPMRTWKETEEKTEASQGRNGKPLLILDLNGVICDRGSFASRKHDKGAVTRPHALEFLGWCFAHFEVAVWSCGKRENMELELFEGRTLVFAWDQSRSTSLWPRNSAVSADKPLFLKEIQQLWKSKSFQPPTVTGIKKAPVKSEAMSWRAAAIRTPPAPSTSATPPPPPRCFGPHDTILLDNHYEKFERNGVGNNLIIKTWTRDQKNDAALARTGTLLQLLEQYASAPDAAAFGKEKALQVLPEPAPEAYIPGPKLIALAVQAQEAISKKKKSASKDSSQADQTPIQSPRKHLADEGQIARILIERYCASEAHREACPEYTAPRYLKSRDSPGPRARPLRRRDLPILAEEGYALTEKTDGERGWFLGCELGVFLLRRDLTLAVRLEDQEALMKSVTILDGEMLLDDKLFVVFDAVRVLDDDIGANGANGAPGRLSVAAKKLGIEGIGRALGDWRVAAKRYWTTDDAELREVARHVSSAGAFADESRTNQSDGLILTRLDDSDCNGYYASQCFKFKPVITLDVRLIGLTKWLDTHRKSIKTMLSSTKKGSITLPAIDAAVAGERSSDIIVSSVLVPEDKLSILFDASSSTTTTLISNRPVAECVYEDGSWKLVRLRLDKRTPNSIRTAWAVLESIADKLSVDEVLDAMQSGRVAAHYDKLQRKRKAKAPMDDAMYRLRRLNNLVKALSLESATHFFVNSSDSTDTIALSRAKRYDDKSTQAVLSLLRSPVTEHDRRNNNTAKSGRGQTRRAVVVELGCGRGGDLGKWRQCRVEIDKLVAVDLSAESIAEAESRWNNTTSNGSRPKARSARGNSVGHEFVQADFAAPGFSTRLRDQLLKKQPADFISCHFAMHYAFSTPERLAEILDAISSNLADNGIFLATVINWTELHGMLTDGPIGDLCSVSASAKSAKAIADLPLHEAVNDATGIQYTFSLGDAVEDCDEFLIHTPTLQTLAKSKGLELLLAQPFSNYLVDAHTRDPTSFARLAADIGVRPNPNKSDNKNALSDDHFRVASLYAVLIFRRTSRNRMEEGKEPSKNELNIAVEAATSRLHAAAAEWTPELLHRA